MTDLKQLPTFIAKERRRAIRAGWDANSDGLDINDNPHMVRHPDYLDWEIGWWRRDGFVLGIDLSETEISP